MLRIFRPAVATVLRVAGAIIALALFVTPVAWGYQQRAEARRWRDVACSYRLKEALSAGRLMTAEDAQAAPCARLDQLGLPAPGQTRSRRASL